MTSDEVLDTRHTSHVTRHEDEMERTFVSLFEEEALARGQQRAVLRLLRRRFGDLPAEAEERLRGITDPGALDDLTDRLLTATSLKELGLSRDGR